MWVKDTSSLGQMVVRDSLTAYWVTWLVDGMVCEQDAG